MEKHKILIVVDCQNDFITGTLANEEAQKKVPNIVKKINEFDGDYIFLTRDTHFDNYLDTPEGKKLPIAHCIKDTEGWEIEDTIAEAIEAKVKEGNTTFEIIDKPTFGSLELVEKIKDAVTGSGCDIEICGFVSSICVITNALLLKTTFFNTANITVDTNCIAGLSEKNNEAALEVLSSCQINIINKN